MSFHSLYHGLLDIEWCFWSVLTRYYLQLAGIKLGSNFRSHGLPMVRRSKGARILLGNDVTMVNHNRANPIGLNHSCIIVAGGQAIVQIGDSTGMSGVVIHAQRQITIGRHVLLGANVKIFDHDFHPLDWQARRIAGAATLEAQPVSIEDDVFIGTGALILKGITVGRGAVIGAGSVVTKSVPPFAVCAGNPARELYRLDDSGYDLNPSATAQTLQGFRSDLNRA